jgi:hypothetical protein
MQLTVIRCLVAGAAAGAIAAIVNAVIYATGAVDQSIETPAGGPIPLGAVIMFSLVPNLIGGAVFWALGRSADPIRLWRIVVVIVTIVSFYTPFTLDGPPTEMLVALLAMHVVAGIAAIVVTPAVAMRGSASAGAAPPRG